MSSNVRGLTAIALLWALAPTTTEALPGAKEAFTAAGEQTPERSSPTTDVDVVERLGERIPDDARFVDSEGRELTLRELLHRGKPVVLSLVYYRCEMLCQLVLSGLVSSAGKTGLRLGEDYLAVTVSIDPKETPAQAAERRRGHLLPFERPIPSGDWPFLTGDASNIGRLVESVGFGYTYDERTQQFAHAAVVMVLTPEGQLSRYLYGMEFSPKDLKLALLEASSGRVGTSFDRLLLRCYRYDPALRRYGFYAHGLLRVGAFAFFLGLTGMLALLWRRELKQGTVR